MDLKKSRLKNTVSLFISKSKEKSSNLNKTGSWRFSLPVYREKSAPCSVACPAGTEIPKVEFHLSRGEIKKAFEKITMENPLPSVCGRVCFHNCENACNRGFFDSPVGIRSLEKFIGDMGLDEDYRFKSSKKDNGKRAAVIGSGPSGLSAAFFLRKLGFSCEIFEKERALGGIMRWGIPSYRLPVAILEKEIDRICNTGIKIHLNKKIDADELKRIKESFDAVYIGCGLGISLQPEITGSEYLSDGSLFLKKVKDDPFRMDGKKVAVIGGGNSAIDISRSAVRMGAQVTILYRRRRKDMPAFINEIKDAVNEGIEIKELLLPRSIEKKGENFEIVLQKMKAENEDKDGRAHITPLDGRTEKLEFHRIISGIGSKIEKPWMKPISPSIELKYSAIDLNSDIPIIFGGDITNTDQSVTDAIASGKEAAIALDLYFKGNKNIKETLDKYRVGNKAVSFEIYRGNREKNSKIADYELINTDYFDHQDRKELPYNALEKARSSFGEVEKNFSYNQAFKEASRCFNCGFCNECDNCRIFCPEASVVIDKNKRIVLTDFCKGCGVCATECPRSAIDMEEDET